MAVGTVNDFTIYDEEFWAGVTETLEQDTDIFNERSNGAIRIGTNIHKGDFEKSTFLQTISNLVTRRDNTSTSGASILKPTGGENVNVKLNRKVGPVDYTRDLLRKIGGVDSREMSFLLGQQWAKAILVDQVNTIVSALKTAIERQTSLTQDQSTAGGAASDHAISHSNLVRVLSRFGDAGGDIVAWVAHSSSFYGLMLQSIEDNIFEVGGMTIIRGVPATLNRPMIVTDSPALKDIDSGSNPNTFSVLGLTPSAGTVMQSEERDIVNDVVTGQENIVNRLQAEYAYTIGLKGYAYDASNGGANPTDASLTTATNWDKVATDDRSTAGVSLIHDES